MILITLPSTDQLFYKNIGVIAIYPMHLIVWKYPSLCHLLVANVTNCVTLFCGVWTVGRVVLARRRAPSWSCSTWQPSTDQAITLSPSRSWKQTLCWNPSAMPRLYAMTTLLVSENTLRCTSRGKVNISVFTWKDCLKYWLSGCNDLVLFCLYIGWLKTVAWIIFWTLLCYLC